MKKLELEYRNEFKKCNDGFQVGNCKILCTPIIDEDYWVFRVKLHNDQSIVAFPKFTTLGIGFAIEENWNTNLPYTCKPSEIVNHIWVNHKYDEIERKDVLRAVKLISKACEYYKKNELTEQVYLNETSCALYFNKLHKFITNKTVEPELPF